ncbi:hypothetical protein PanWU01x14_094320 [Parasponia andersonii]|uniref:Uncharacterized protein n=1 Tax=Parasponia andersonii TaxID=3476 RepID=A0A2P5D5P8_PARAD|nr:hypothetical protein PanWU01x14_094320 [Parasponia andersonii]
MAEEAEQEMVWRHRIQPVEELESCSSRMRGSSLREQGRGYGDSVEVKVGNPSWRHKNT